MPSLKYNLIIKIKIDMYFNINSFDISVSLQGYKDKSQIDWGKVVYFRYHTHIDEFASLIKKGYCFCHCFKAKQFGIREKTNANFEKADLVFIDIDDCDIEMKEFVGRLTHKPTLYYTTPSNRTAKSNYLYRFRLAYLFNQSITDVATYNNLYLSIVQGIETDIPTFHNKDNCGKSPSQQFGGNANSDCELYINKVSYSIEDFPFKSNIASFSSSILFLNGKEDKTDTIKTSIEIADKEFVADLNTLKTSDLIEKYRCKYWFFDHSPIVYSDGYAMLGEDYYEIYRKWGIDSFEKNNGDIINYSRTLRLRDGEQRRRKLYIAALIRKQILPTITFEHLLFNLICEREWYCDNSDKQLTYKVLSSIAANVVRTPLENICLKSRNKKKFVIDKSYCENQGINVDAFRQKIRKQLKDAEIGNLYDPSISINENLVILNENGVKVGKTKLYEWCKENNIATKPIKKNVVARSNKAKDYCDIAFAYYLCNSKQERERLKELYSVFQATAA